MVWTLPYSTSFWTWTPKGTTTSIFLNSFGATEKWYTEAIPGQSWQAAGAHTNPSEPAAFSFGLKKQQQQLYS